MSRLSLISILTLAIIVMAFTCSGESLDGSIPRGSQLLGIANSDGTDAPFDKHLKSELDNLLPQLKQINSDATILIEAFYPEKKGKSKQQQISMAFSLAEQVHQYLKIKQSLDRDFILAIWENPADKSKYPKIRLTTYPQDYFDN